MINSNKQIESYEESGKKTDELLRSLTKADFLAFLPFVRKTPRRKRRAKKNQSIC
jgi:hypothetical protein